MTKEERRASALRLPQYGESSGDAFCQWPGCTEKGVFPAPRSRSQLRDFQYFCLAHIRIVNARWDYFDGMTTSEIDAYRRADVTWHRPTWRPGLYDPNICSDWHDWFDVLRGRNASSGEAAAEQPPSTAERMMRRLELRSGFSLDDLKGRYRALVKKHHPDLHAGSKRAEERLKLINEAYTYLLEHRLYC